MENTALFVTEPLAHFKEDLNDINHNCMYNQDLHPYILLLHLRLIACSASPYYTSKKILAFFFTNFIWNLQYSFFLKLKARTNKIFNFSRY